ncbi:MAG: ATP-binding protein [Candidatus Gracilibacteria bacterium]|nr:ATP-binding protein [Candidatus Gracilibacteria bacterium]
MATLQKTDSFDAFFANMMNSDDFKHLTKDLENMQKSMKEMDESMSKAGDLTNSLNNTFATPEVIQEGQKSTQTGGAKDDKTVSSVKVEYFIKDNPETWGFNGIAGMSDLKKELLESFVNPLKFKFLVQNLEKQTDLDPKKTEIYKKLYSQYEKFKISIPTGLLFYGPPGTGKTFITKKLAQELGAGLIVKSAGEFGSSYQHQTSQNIRAFFADSKKEAEKGPIILFLDEIDSILSKRTNNIDAGKAEEVSQFLQEFNNLATAQNLIVIAATNRPDHLDSAILRSGRLDKKIYIGPPDFIARKEMFEMYIKKEDRPHDELDYDELAFLTEGYVSADIETICDEVSRDASKHILDLAGELEKGDFDEKDILSKIEGQKITMELLKQAIKDTTSSLKMVDMNIYTKWIESLS